MERPEGNGGGLPPARQPSQRLTPAEGPIAYYGRSDPEGAASGLSLGAIADMLWRRRWTIAVSIVAVTLLAALMTLRTPQTFESTAMVLVQSGNERGSALEVLEGVGTTETPLQTESRLITSRRVIESAAASLGMHVSVEDASGEKLRPQDAFRGFAASPNALPGEYRVAADQNGGYTVMDAIADTAVARVAAGDRETVIEFVGVRLAVEPDDPGLGGVVIVSPFLSSVAKARQRVSASPVSEEANLIEISCVAGQAVAAERLCRAVTDSYLRLKMEVQRAEAEAAAEFLGGQVEEVGGRLEAAEDSLGAYQEQRLAIALDERARSEVNQYSALEYQREQLETDRAALASLIREMDRSGTPEAGYRELATFPGFVKDQSPVVSKLMQNLIELEDRRSELAITRTDRNPDIVAVDARIAEIENQLRSFAGSYERALGSQVRSIEQAMGRSQGQLSTIPARQVATSRLQRQVNLLQELYGYLQTRLREAEIARNINLPGVSIVDEASLPLGPSSPDLRMNLILGLILGLGLGTVIALYREYTDSSVRGRKEVERQTGIPVLGMIPSVKTQGPVLAISGPNGGGVLPNAGKRRLGSTTQAEAKSSSVLKARTLDQQLALEAFRSLLMDLRTGADAAGSRRIRSVAITSATRGDGKTFTACNLAIASAAQGSRTLLVDTDLRARGVSRFFGIPWASPGLVDVLQGGRSYRGVLNDLHVVVDHSSLHVISSGDPRSAEGGILERWGQQLDALMIDAESDYDLVVVDTPPLNVITDAATIATRADAVLVVVRGNVTDRDALDLTLQRLRVLNANVLGIVLNDVDLPEYYTSYSRSPDEE